MWSHAGIKLLHEDRDVTDAADIAPANLQVSLLQKTPASGSRRGRIPYGSDAARGQDHSRPRLRTNPGRHDRPIPLADIAFDQWQRLADRAIEPNGYYLPDWELAVNASAHGRGDVVALSAWGKLDNDAGTTARLIGLMPAISAWRAYRLPFAALVSADPYGTLGTPLLDEDAAEEAAQRMIWQARDAGKRALILRDIPLQGPVALAFTRVLDAAGLAPRILQARARAGLDATNDAETLLHDGLGSKKLKELRRQRNRLADHGNVTFDIARTPADVARALDVFFALEASGWKAQRGTALTQDAGDASFMRNATAALSARGQCEIVTLKAGTIPVAAGVVLRHRDRAFWFKIGIDERFRQNVAGRPARARTHPASVRGPGYCLRQLHGKFRSSDDRPDLAHALCDR